MGIAKKILLTAECDECGAKMEKAADCGGKRDMVEYARYHGWSYNEVSGLTLCPACREEKTDGRAHASTHKWRKTKEG